MLEQYFLSNPHRVTLVLKPDPSLAEKEEAKERQLLAEIRSTMDLEEVQRAIDQTNELKRVQQAPDPPEALKTIPTLKLSDLERKNRTIPLEITEEKETKILFHNLPTSSIAYLDVGFNLRAIEQEYLPYVPLFGRSLVELGTEQEDFVALTQRIGRDTGGIYSQSLSSALRGEQKTACWLFLRGKAMGAKSNRLMSILKDVLLTVKLDSKKRFQQMVMEEKARQEEKLVPEGHQVVNLRLRSHFNEADWAAEQMRGVSYLFFLKELNRKIDEDWPGVLASLEHLKITLVNRQNMLVNITCDDQGWAELKPLLNDFLEELPSTSVHIFKWSPKKIAPFEGMIIPSQVNYVGKGANLYQLGYRLHGSVQVISRYIRTGWLWDQVRVQGGAYGAFSIFNYLSGTFTFVSYRDPNLTKTINVFDETVKYLRSGNLTHEEITKGIIGTIGDLDKHLLPDAKGYTSMVRYLTNDSEENRQILREEVLNTSAADFENFAHALAALKENGLVKVLGSASAIESAAAQKKGWLEIFRVL
jgi:Zn-dependent M16 (insulinase) family peptidase